MPLPIVIHVVIYFVAFLVIWIGSGMAIGAVEKLARLLRVSSFAVSFLLLGFFTSISELSVGVNALARNDPEIFVGNLIGASIVLFMLIIPLLTLTGTTIKISTEFRGFNLSASLLVIVLPVVLIADGYLSKIEALLAVGAFLFLALSVQMKRGLLEKISSIRWRPRPHVGQEFVRIIAGVTMIFIASRVVVDQTLYFSHQFHFSPFLISVIVIGIGTNIPELSLVVRSLFMKNNQVAFGDYVGSAAFNTFLLGMLTLLGKANIYLENGYIVSSLFLIVGLLLFYLFSKTKNSISMGEGAVLATLYVLFVATELYTRNVL